jgi:hypothetical protein
VFLRGIGFTEKDGKWLGASGLVIDSGDLVGLLDNGTRGSVAPGIRLLDGSSVAADWDIPTFTSPEN